MVGIRLLVPVILLLSVRCYHCHSLSSDEIRAEINEFVEALMSCNDIPGLSLAVTRADEVKSA